MIDTATPCVRADGLVRRFGKTVALDSLSFTVKGGHITGLLGRNGAGKSTLLRILCGQLRQNEGEISLFGMKVYDNAAALGELCMICDTPDFGQLNKIKDYFYVMQGMFPNWNMEYALELCKRFDLPLNRRIKGFSRGMQTSLMLSAGLASGARLTVFDEPSLGLDAVMRERFYDLLLDAHKENLERSFILSTHLIDEVARTLDYAVLIDHGRLLAEDDIHALTSGYMSISGSPEAVSAASEGMTVLREEEVAGSLVRYLRLTAEADRERLKGAEGVQTADISLQRLFVFLTEESEVSRNADNA